MSHAAARWCSDASNERHNRLVGLVVLLQPLSSVLFSTASDLADHDDTLSFRVVDKAFKTVNEVSTVERITTNANTCGLAKVGDGGLMHSLISESAGPADNTDLAWLVNVAGHYAHLALSWLDDARAIRPNEAAFVLTHESMLDLHHVLLWNAFGNADNERNFSFEGFHHCRCSSRRWDIDHGGIAISFFLRLRSIGKDGQIQVCGAGLLFVHTTNYFGAVVDCLRCVERSLPARHTLDQDFCVFVNPHLGC
mmetsp:Transcript_50576/g.100669  ORF Transcript_50576/g.100669 Transcript_50576/m.100669 type:complete len:252 (+) Transcript_50576:220-975(+)